MANGLINAEAGKNFLEVRNNYVKQIAPNVNNLIDGFQIPEAYAPIAGDYEDYNSRPNFGELGPAPKL